MIPPAKTFNRSLALVALVLGLVIAIWIEPYFVGEKLINPVLIDIGGWQIRWYGLLMATGVVVGWHRLLYETKTTKFAEHITDLVIWVVSGGLIGARGLFVLLKWPEFVNSLGTIFDLSQGGLSIHGAILGGALATFIYCRRQRWPVLATYDLLVIPLILGQIVGRLGNFFNQEAFGGPTVLPWKMWVAPNFRPVGYESFAWFHPTFLYEIIGLWLILSLITTLLKRNLFAGGLTLVYLVSYSVLRFGIEYFRIDSDKWGALTVAQWGSLGIIMGGLIIGLILKRRRNL